MKVLRRLVVVAAVTVIAGPVAVVEAAPSWSCDGQPATIVGTPGDDLLRGTRGPDVIVGLGGVDRIVGRGGDDVICGGDGADSITGGPGADRLFGNGGVDRINGGDGHDHLDGGIGGDRLAGGRGTDAVRGRTGTDRCWAERAACERRVLTPTSRKGPLVAFTWAIHAVNHTNSAEVASTWHPGCPVPRHDLRLITVAHRNDRGHAATGRLVVHHAHAEDLVRVFGRLHDAGFPIHRIDLIDRFEGDDDRSMRANNTSSFNCREIDGQPGTWSQHASGLAVDINPLVNPWVRGSQVDPPEGAPYADRTRTDVPGMIKAGDVVTAAFDDIGWYWGGTWTASKDYQHFSSTGR